VFGIETAKEYGREPVVEDEVIINLIHTPAWTCGVGHGEKSKYMGDVRREYGVKSN
jgi:hypothetical protein